MTVQEIMTPAPQTCGPQSNLAEVAHLMWEADCGIVPITDREGKLLGVITDRDICIAAATQDKRPSEIRADQLPRGDVHACHPQDEMHAALRLMREWRVRRLPVTGSDGTLRGIISINDIVLAAGGQKQVSAVEVLDTLKDISAHRRTLQARESREGARAAAR